MCISTSTGSQEHYVWVRASVIIWSEYIPLISRVFVPYCKLRTELFFHRFMAQARSARTINRWKKTRIRNLQYGPKKTRLIAELWRAKRACGAPWVSKSTHPRKFGNHVTVQRPPAARPSAPQGNQCSIPHFLASLGAQKD